MLLTKLRTALRAGAIRLPGTSYPANVSADGVRADGEVVLYRQLLTMLEPDELTTPDDQYLTAGVESYLTELNTQAPLVTVQETRYALSAWVVSSSTELRGGPADAQRGTWVETLVSFTSP